MRACSEVYLRACSEVYLGAYSEVVLGNVLAGVLGSLLRAYLEAYSQAGWDCAIEHNQECIKQAGGVQSSVLQSVLGSVQ